METPTAVGVQRATAHRAALSESEWRIGQTVIHSPFFIERYPVGCDKVNCGNAAREGALGYDLGAPFVNSFAPVYP